MVIIKIIIIIILTPEIATKDVTYFSKKEN